MSQTDSPDSAPATNTAPDASATDGQPVITSELSVFSDKLKGLVADPSWDKAADTFLPVMIEVGQIIFVSVLLLVVVSFLSRWAQKAVTRAVKHTRIEPTIKVFLIRVTKYTVWILAVPVALSVLGVQATSLAAVIGAAGLAIGLGLQGALANISAGILLLMLRPIHVGDFVEIQGEVGEVKELGLFYTVINTFNNEVVSIPNQQILSDKVENLTGNTFRRVEIPVGVAYGTDLRKAESLLLEAVTSVPTREKSQDPKVFLTGFGESSIDFIVFVHCPARSFFVVRHEAIHAINDALAKAGIEIPFPQRTISGNLRVVGDSKDD